MSRTLTAEVNDELIRVPNRHDACRRTQLATMLRMSAEMRMRGGLTLAVEVASAATARYLRREIAELQGISAAATVLGRNRYEVRVAQGSADLAIETGLIDSRGNEALGLPIAVVGGTLSEVAAAWRGAFLMAGSLAGPGRDAALTVSCPSPETAHALASLARRLGVLALVRENRERDHVLVRDADRDDASPAQVNLAAALKVPDADTLDRRDLSDMIALAQAEKWLPFLHPPRA